MARSVQVILAPLSVGDVKPVGILVNPSDRAHIVSGTWALVVAQTGAAVPSNVTPASGNFLLDPQNDGSAITTDNPVNWGTAGTYICRCALVWSDGQQDYTLSAKILVQPPAT